MCYPVGRTNLHDPLASRPCEPHRPCRESVGQECHTPFMCVAAQLLRIKYIGMRRSTNLNLVVTQVYDNSPVNSSVSLSFTLLDYMYLIGFLS
jgi:hypothetical protein